MKNSLLIHNDNVPFKSKFTETIVFKPTSVDIDEYITHEIIPKIKELTPQVIYIKDNLSLNYLELYGLRLIYHIRLSQELGDRQLLPIVLLSDLDSFLLNRLSTMGRVVFTKNIFIAKNSIEAVKKFDSLEIQPFKTELYQDEFLNLIEVEPPKDYLSHHDISNEWAIYRWAKFLKVDSDAIRTNREKIASMLYFKYLLAKNPISKSSSITSCVYPVNTGKILYIDDEYNKGWSYILKSYFEENSKTKFDTFEYDFKHDDTNTYTLIQPIRNKILSCSPDIIILDLRLTKNDKLSEQRSDIDSFSGIKIRQLIKEISPAIQVIMFTATSKSVILDKLYEHNILGYIKKEHPNDKNLTTSDNFAKLARLTFEGFEKSYLKEVWKISEDILELNLSKEINFEVKSVFEILDSSMGNKFNYAIFAIFKCIEIVTSLYIKEKDKKAYWRDNNTIVQNIGYYQYRKKEIITDLEHIKNENNKFYRGQGNISVENKIRAIMHNRLGLTSDDIHSQIKCIVCVRNYIIHQDKEYDDKDFCKKVIEQKISKEQLIKWFKMLQTILQKIEQ